MARYDALIQIRLGLPDLAWLGLLVAFASLPANATAPRLAPEQVARLAAGAGCPAAARWRFEAGWNDPGGGRIERWAARECREPRRLNLHVASAAPGELAVTVLLPGDTRQPATVQQTAALAVLAQAAAPTCRERRVVDTRLRPGGSEATTERWTVEACGARRRFDVVFTTAPDGTVAIRLDPIAGNELSR